VAGKNLYEILGVPESADAEAIRAAHAAALAQPDAGKDGAASRIALAEAARILTDGRLRGEYDRKLMAARMQPMMPVAQAPRARFGGAIAAVVILGLVGIPAYMYNEKRIERRAAEKAAELRRAEEQKRNEEILARNAQRAAEAEQRMLERNRQYEEQRMYAEQQRDRARGAYNSMVVNRQLENEARNAEREREQQRRAEEARRQREEYEARMRLEEDKRRLRQLECQNGRC
jgi:hypothetical protein